MSASLVAVVSRPLELETLHAAVISAHQAHQAPEAAGGDTGAVASFVGVVRRENLGRRVLRLEYEAFEPLAVTVLGQIQDEARQSWPGVTLALHHRIGPLAVGEVSVIIVAASAHRADAFAVCRYGIERIKQIAPIWKHEYFEGGDAWVEGAVADPVDQAARMEAYRRACG